jgi:hypothetical protein
MSSGAILLCFVVSVDTASAGERWKLGYSCHLAIEIADARE